VAGVFGAIVAGEEDYGKIRTNREIISVFWFFLDFYLLFLVFLGFALGFLNFETEMGDYKDFFGFYWDICANYI
jgi:hypothetical protein